MCPPSGQDAEAHESSSVSPPSAQAHQSSKSQRILACILCQQRKIKCDRRFPCANCIKYKAQCIPATQSRRRRRRFPEKELLDRLRRYEDLMRQNGVEFDPLHPGTEMEGVKRSVGKDSPEDWGEGDSDDDEHKGGTVASRVESAFEVK